MLAKKSGFLGIFLLIIFLFPGNLVFNVHAQKSQGRKKNAVHHAVDTLKSELPKHFPRHDRPTKVKLPDSTMVNAIKTLHLLQFKSPHDTAKYFVILFPGDGGWRDVMNTVTKLLNDQGISVVGFNTVPYFRKKRTPREVALDIQLVMDYYSRIWNKKSVVIGGYSFSAEVIPFAYNAMDPAYRNKILHLILLAPSLLADFKIGTLFIYPTSKSTPLLPELKKIDPGKMLIICDGIKESLCPSLSGYPDLDIVHFACNHWFVGYRKEVALVITERLESLKNSK